MTSLGETPTKMVWLATVSISVMIFHGDISEKNTPADDFGAIDVLFLVGWWKVRGFPFMKTSLDW